MQKIMIALIALLSIPALATIDERFPESATFISNSNILRFQYMAHEGTECIPGNTTKLISRVPFYVYAPAINNTQVKTGKFPALIFLHGMGEQGPSMLNMCYTRDDTYYASIASTLNKVENQAGGPGAAILAGNFNPAENMVVIIPQSMQRGGFSTDVIRRVISDTATQMASKGIELDADRIYLTGLSMGGGSLMQYLANNPNHFAAAIPIEAAGGIDACWLRTHTISFWGFAGGASGNMGAGTLLNIINGTSNCPDSVIEYINPAYTCVYNTKSCTRFSAPRPNNLRATFMPANGHNGWREIYNGTHNALPTTEKNIYNWLLAQKNSDQGKPLFPIQYLTNGSSSSATTSSIQSSSSSPGTSSSLVASSAPSSYSSTQSSSSSSTPTGSPATILLTPAMIVPGSPGNPDALVDEQTSTAPTNYWFAGWSTSIYPVSAIIDLGREYTITEITLYDANGTGLVEFSDADPAHSQGVIVSDGLTRYLAFTSYSVSVQTRYLRVKKYNAATLGEIKLQGY
ncbi:hypothetical protein [Cellvibrio mixtus]|uniref:hypothetical protein n=1 Tax=Cellvibrio mixtus TaxID=39650 RepID=UPI00058790D5|nr:hypothetical protein [Cellvibrio mixtus]